VRRPGGVAKRESQADIPFDRKTFPSLHNLELRIAPAGFGGSACGMSNLLAFVVEDSPVIQENLIAALEEMAPVKVVGTAVDQAGALSWLADGANQCDIAIIDIFLRQGSGMGVLRALHAAGAPFERVVLTNYATADIRRQCLALGASAVFDKSGEIDALVDHCVARASRPA
jgi:DNA-binding NarL/FixJ family response regulator